MDARYTHINDAPTQLRWGAVLGGAAIGFALLLLLSSLWLAMAFQGIEAVENQIQWYLAGSVMAALLLGGFLAGWLSGIRRTSSGVLNGLTVWAVALIASGLVGTPGLIGLVGLEELANAFPAVDAEQAMWATFWALLVSAVLAGAGGAIGGATAPVAPTVVDVTDREAERREVERHEPAYAERHEPAYAERREPGYTEQREPGHREHREPEPYVEHPPSERPPETRATDRPTEPTEPGMARRDRPPPTEASDDQWTARRRP